MDRAREAAGGCGFERDQPTGAARRSAPPRRASKGRRRRTRPMTKSLSARFHRRPACRRSPRRHQPRHRAGGIRGERACRPRGRPGARRDQARQRPGFVRRPKPRRHRTDHRAAGIRQAGAVTLPRCRGPAHTPARTSMDPAVSRSQSSVAHARPRWSAGPSERARMRRCREDEGIVLIPTHAGIGQLGPTPDGRR